MKTVSIRVFENDYIKLKKLSDDSGIKINRLVKGIMDTGELYLRTLTQLIKNQQSEENQNEG